MTLAMFAISAFFLLLAVHPFITYPLTLRFMRPRKSAATGLFTGNMAVCVCAYNEEGVIEQKAENLLALKQVFPDIELLVYVDAASDRTAEILKKYEQDIHVHVSPKRNGKTHGMNLLVSKTQAPLIVFSDANVMLDVESLRALPGYFSDPQVGCVCGHLKYLNENETATAKNGSLYWRIEEYIKTMESATGSVMGADGSIFAIRRALHTPPPDAIIDDMFVSFSILCDGYRIVRAPDVVAYEKSVTSAHEEFKRKVRIACQAFNVHRLLWPRLRNLSALDLYKYVSHKLMRWFVIYWLTLAVFFFEAGMAAAGDAAAGIILIILSLAVLCIGMFKKLPIITQIADIIGAFAATGLGVLRSIKGENFQTWAPAASIRAR